ncbi:glycosyltransferase [Streptomyces lunaelactis]|nr:glycosyltransferase [Streptomyces lunaelactis]NUL11947.1 glycosyltransferase [Streptomyces lunaelactis]NUL25580.1 glycosyltransferase [Streptomyces lunaelactis]
MDLELIVPAFNEERRLPGTIACTIDYLSGRPWTSAVVVVDNDSADCTLEAPGAFGDAPVSTYVIGCSSHGRGAAVRRGIATSAARFVGFVDADNATPIGTLDMVMALLSEGYAAVIASRRAPGPAQGRRVDVPAAGATDLAGHRRYAMRIQVLRRPARPRDRQQLPHRRFRLRRRAPRPSLAGGAGHHRGTGRLVGRAGVDLLGPHGRSAIHGRPPPYRPLAVTAMTALDQLAGADVLFPNWRDPSYPQAGGAEREEASASCPPIN